MLWKIDKFTVSAAGGPAYGWNSSRLTVRNAKTVIPCILSGILLAIPFNFGKLWLFSWLGFVPLFIALKNKSRLGAFFVSFITGIVFWSATIYWLIHVTLAGTIILVLYLALYFGLFGFLFSTLDNKLPRMAFICVPSLWVVLEYLRGHLLTGFPWALLGYSQYLNLPVIQISDITGAWGVSFLVMMVNITIHSVFGARVTGNWLRVTGLGAIKNNIIPLLCLAVALIYGCYKLYRSPFPVPRSPDIKVSVIQGNIPQELKWNPVSRSYIVNKYLEITQEALKDKPDLVVWPEASLPVVLEEESEFFTPVKALSHEAKTPLLLGAVTIRDSLYYNSALLVSAKGEVVERYDKLHLVPFGEYIPFRKALSFLETIAPIGDIQKGAHYTVFDLPPKFSVLICFEDLFPEISREFIKRNAGFLVNVTNDAWYKDTPAAFQHFQASVFRAVENRSFLVRAANTGVSGFISPTGKIISLVRNSSGKNIFVAGRDTQGISVLERPVSFYGRHGDVFTAFCFLFVLYGIMSKTVTSKLVTRS